MKSLRAANFGNLQPAYHYMVFAHYATCPDSSHCSACSSDPESGAEPDPTSTGSADLPGDDVIIAAANLDVPMRIEQAASTFMHELGHNFGLQHGGDENVNQKPNYTSVMNYSYQFGGIPVADAPGSTNPIFGATEADCGPPAVTSGACAIPNACHLSSANYCYRVDYSNVLLGSLDEAHLNETVGVTGAPSDEDILLYYAPAGQLLGASNGSPIDWNNDGTATETDVQVNLNGLGTVPELLHSQNDWETSGGLFTKLNFRFQCTEAFGSPSYCHIIHDCILGSVAAPTTCKTAGMSRDYAIQHHILYLPKKVSIAIRPGCSQARKPIAPGEFGTVTVALLGSDSLDLTQVETSSLSFHGAKAQSTSIRDVNGDGKPDLVAEFEMHGLHLHPEAINGTLTGWLKNSQAFFGSDQVVIVPSMAFEDNRCR